MKNNNDTEGLSSDIAMPIASAVESDDTDIRRRTFLCALTAGAAAIALTACGGSATTNTGSNPPSNPSGNPPPPAPPPPSTPPSGANQSPVWQSIPTIAFTQGVASTFSIAGFVNDADGDPLTILKNSAALPPGVTYDAANKQFVYDGVGAVGSTGGHVLTADDGRT